MKTSFVLLSVIVRKESREEIWPLRGFFVVSLILVDPGGSQQKFFREGSYFYWQMGPLSHTQVTTLHPF